MTNQKRGTEGTLYRCCNGRYYGDVDVWTKLESGEWSSCCWNIESGEEWMHTREETLLHLKPIPPSALPEGVEWKHAEGGFHVVSEPHAPDYE